MLIFDGRRQKKPVLP